MHHASDQAFNPSDHPHRRRNPLTGEWVLVSPHRARRPWLGQQERVSEPALPAHDPGCYLCAGNLRVGGERNPDYRGPYVFANDFPALLAQAPQAPATTNPLFEQQAVQGECRVICFSQDHARGLSRLDDAERLAVVDTWCAQTAELARRWAWVQVFENQGEAMGCSNPHPHGQVWASAHVPHELALEARTQRAWLAEHGEPMLLQLARREAALGERVVVQGAHWLAIVPYWASWPFETLLLPRFAVHRLDALTPEARADLAWVLGELTRRYDGLFDCRFPYSMGWHGAPFDGSAPEACQLHAHFYPPLLRSATVRKFMVGYEMLAEAQRDLTPEQAAERLRAVAPGGVR